MDNKHNNKEGFKLPPSLDAIGKENPFSVPEKYFDELPLIIANKIADNKEHSIWLLLSNLLKKKETILTLSVCSIICLCILIYPIINRLSSVQPSISEYIIKENYNSFDEEMLTDFLAENEEDESKSNDYMIDYLLNNDTDINLILEELK